jgi:Domain of unknown function (DUF4304)
MSPLLKDLLSELHQLYFKPNGFSKTRQRFRRDIDVAMQEVEFQSSQWNSAADPTRFYVNVSLGFADIPMRDGKPALTGTTRVHSLVPGAPPHYDLTAENHAQVREELLQSIPQALAELPKHHEDVRTYALRGSHCVIPIPSLWRSSS